jgi:high-affinity iron transporter
VFATFVIGLREGLEAALVVGILVAFLVRSERRDVLPRLWLGVGLAIGLSLAFGFVLTFGAYTLSFEAQEILGGTLSILAVAMVTTMVFWMQRAARGLRGELEGGMARAIATGGLWGVVAIGFISVAREGVETALFLWSMFRSFGGGPEALIGAIVGLAVAVVLGYLIYRGMVRINLRVFFNVTSIALIVVAAGVLAYGIHDLQEAGVLPGPYTSAAPTDPATGTVAVGLAGFPFGWAFEIGEVLPPDGALAALLKGTIGLAPQMSWLEVIAWATYLVVVLTVYIRRARASSPPRPAVPVTTTPSVSRGEP